MKNKLIHFLIIFVLSFLFAPLIGCALAQEQNSFEQQFQTVQFLDSRISNLTNLIAMIAAVFGVIIAIVLAFFTIRQWSVDREVKLYKEEIRRQKELVESEANSVKKELADIKAWLKSKKEDIQKILDKPSSKKTRQELKKLQEEIDKLKEELSYKQGVIESTPLPHSISLNHSASDILGSTIYASDILSDEKTCQGCGKKYKKYSAGYTLVGGTRCPHCGYYNY